MMKLEEIKQFDEIFDMLGDNLDISKTQHEIAKNSYIAVGKWLADSLSLLSPYQPNIRPQGSFMLGTMIKPVCDKDELDIDLVCELTGKNASWTQYDIKKIVGDRLKDNKKYKEILDEEGRRCWTLKYSENAHFHMDILPSLVSYNHRIILEKAYSSIEDSTSLDSMSIRITDKEEENYYSDPNPANWMKSNPFGYGRWFLSIANIDHLQKAMLFSESINPLPKYTNKKLPLQRIVQILKRHRDVMFDGSDSKPISIIITTLSALAYKKEDSVTDGLVNIINSITNNIEERYDYALGRKIKWIPNPVNPEENFADKWIESSEREANFYAWVDKLKQDIHNILNSRGLHNISEPMKEIFGDKTIIKTFSDLGDKSIKQRKDGNLMMAFGTGVLGVTGNIAAKPHNFHGNE